MKEDIETFIEEIIPNEGLTLADGLEKAFVGVSVEEDPPRVVYSIERSISSLTEKGMSHEKASEHFWRNIAGAYAIWINTPE